MKIKVNNNGSFSLLNIRGVAKEPINARYDRNGTLVLAEYCRANQRFTVSNANHKVLANLATLGTATNPVKHLLAAGE